MSTASYIQSIANKVIEEYGYLNPFYIVGKLKRVEFKQLPLTENINGFYKYISPNRQMIVINENLTGEKLNIVLFHELSHYFLGHTNTLLLNCSVTSDIKEEHQANLCGAYLYSKYVSHNKEFENITYPKEIYELLKKFR